MDEDNNTQQHSIIEMPWVLISNQIQQMNQNMNARFDDVNKRFDDVNKRIDDVNKRVDGIEEQMKDMKSDMKDMKSDMLTKPGYYTTIIGTIVMLILGALLNQHIHFF